MVGYEVREADGVQMSEGVVGYNKDFSFTQMGCTGGF